MNCPECERSLPQDGVCRYCLAVGHASDLLRDEPTLTDDLESPTVNVHIDTWPLRKDDLYTPIKLIGRGGMGEVWLVRDPRNGMTWCMKRPHHATGRQLARFLKEIELLKDKNCADIVPCYDYGRDHQGPFLVMPYYQNGSLQEVVAAKGPLANGGIYDLAKALGRGVQHLHQQGILHRDIKPANILLTDDGHPCLADFGLARAETGSSAHSGVVGTASYMAPELVQGVAASPASDIYSLGCTLRFAATGCPPGSGREDLIPQVWRHIVLRCTEVRPQDRFASAADFLQAVDNMRFASDTAASLPCPECEAPTDKSEQVCPACNAWLMEACGTCEADVRKGMKVCGSCGANMMLWRRALSLNEQVGLLVAEAAFDQAKQVQERIADLLPGNHRLPAQVRLRIERAAVTHNRLVSRARSADQTAGPEQGAIVWRQILAEFPKDARAAEAVRTAEARQRTFTLTAKLEAIRTLIASGAFAEATTAVDEARPLARTAAERAQLDGLAEDAEAARATQLANHEFSFAAQLQAGDFQGAKRTLAKARAVGLDAEQARTMLGRIGQVRKAQVRRDIVVTAVVLLLATGGVLAFLSYSRAGAERQLVAALTAFAQGDHAGAAERVAALSSPSAEARQLLADARRAMAADGTAAAAVELWQAQQRWRMSARELPPQFDAHYGELVENALFRLLRSGLEDGTLQVGEAPILVPLDGLLKLDLTLAGRSIASTDNDLAIDGDLADGRYDAKVRFTAPDLEPREFPLPTQIRRAPLQLAAAQTTRELTVDGEGPYVAQFEVSLRNRHLPMSEVMVRPTVQRDAKATAAAKARADDDWVITVTANAPGRVEVRLEATEPPTRRARLDLVVDFTRREAPKPVRQFDVVGELPTLTRDGRQRVTIRTNATPARLLRSGAGSPVDVPFRTAEDDRLTAEIDLQPGDNALTVVTTWEGTTREERTWLVAYDAEPPRRSDEATQFAVASGQELRIAFDEVVSDVKVMGSQATAIAEGSSVRLRAPEATSGRLTTDLEVADAVGNRRTVSVQYVTAQPCGQVDPKVFGSKSLTGARLLVDGTRIWIATADRLVAADSGKAVCDLSAGDPCRIAADAGRWAWLDGNQTLHTAWSGSLAHADVLRDGEQTLGMAFADQSLVLLTQLPSGGDGQRLRARLVASPYRTSNAPLPLDAPQLDPETDPIEQFVVSSKRGAVRTRKGDLWISTGGNFTGWVRKEGPGFAKGRAAVTALAPGEGTNSFLVGTQDGAVSLRQDGGKLVEIHRTAAATAIEAVAGAGGFWAAVTHEGRWLVACAKDENPREFQWDRPAVATAIATTAAKDRKRVAAFALLGDGTLWEVKL